MKIIVYFSTSTYDELNYDLMSSKLMRGASVDFEDCLALAEAHQSEIDINRLIDHFRKLVGYDIAQDRLRPNMDRFLELLKEKGLYD